MAFLITFLCLVCAGQFLFCWHCYWHSKDAADDAAHSKNIMFKFRTDQIMSPPVIRHRIDGPVEVKYFESKGPTIENKPPRGRGKNALFNEPPPPLSPLKQETIRNAVKQAVTESVAVTELDPNPVTPGKLHLPRGMQR